MPASTGNMTLIARMLPIYQGQGSLERSGSGPRWKRPPLKKVYCVAPRNPETQGEAPSLFDTTPTPRRVFSGVGGLC